MKRLQMMPLMSFSPTQTIFTTMEDGSESAEIMFGFPMNLGAGLPTAMADGLLLLPLDGSGCLLQEASSTGDPVK